MDQLPWSCQLQSASIVGCVPTISRPIGYFQNCFKPEQTVRVIVIVQTCGPNPNCHVNGKHDDQPTFFVVFQMFMEIRGKEQHLHLAGALLQQISALHHHILHRLPREGLDLRDTWQRRQRLKIVKTILNQLHPTCSHHSHGGNCSYKQIWVFVTIYMPKLEGTSLGERLHVSLHGVWKNAVPVNTTRIDHFVYQTSPFLGESSHTWTNPCGLQSTGWPLPRRDPPCHPPAAKLPRTAWRPLIQPWEIPGSIGALAPNQKKDKIVDIHG